MSDDFSGLGLSAKVTDAVAAAGYTKPTEIQAQAIPHVLNKQDIIGIAQTGTGKTASFVLPMLTLLESGRARARMPRTLILEPTRELAAQVAENFEKYGKNHRLTMALLIGGVSFDDQNKMLDRGADVLIATPGRMLDQFERGRILLDRRRHPRDRRSRPHARHGVHPRHRADLRLLPPRRQTLFFSATMPPEIERLTKRFLRDPVRIEVARKNSVVETIDQRLIKVSSKPEEKRAALRQLIRGADGLTNAIIFCNRKRDVATLARSLQRHGFSAGELHGDMDQKNRTETLEAFKTNKLTLLVASRRRGARPRHSGGEPRLQLRRADPRRGLHPPHRPHRPCRPVGHRASRSPRPSDGKYLDAIVKLIQKDIPLMARRWRRRRGDTPETSDEPRGESRSRSRGRSRHTGDGKTTREPREPRREAKPPPRESTKPVRRATSRSLARRAKRPNRDRRARNPSGGRAMTGPLTSRNELRSMLRTRRSVRTVLFRPFFCDQALPDRLTGESVLSLRSTS